MPNPPTDLPITVTEDGHWLWTGRLDDNGYGRYGRNSWAHRLVWVRCGRVLEKGKELCHSCQYKRCVNPDHLNQDTHHSNMLDAVKSGVMRGPRGITDKDVALVNYLLNTTDMPKGKIAKLIGVSPQWMSKFLRGEFKYAQPIAAPE